MVRNTPSVQSLRDSMTGRHVESAPEDRFNSTYSSNPSPAIRERVAMVLEQQKQQRLDSGAYQWSPSQVSAANPADEAVALREHKQMQAVYPEHAPQAPVMPTTPQVPIGNHAIEAEDEAGRMVHAQEEAARQQQAQLEQMRRHMQQMQMRTVPPVMYAPPPPAIPTAPQVPSIPVMPEIPTYYMPAMNTVNLPVRNGSTVQTQGNNAQQDYEHQLLLLEQQNQRGKLLKQQQAASREQAYKAPPQSDQRRKVLAQLEMRDMAYGTPNSRWERDHTPLLVKPLAECTPQEHAQIEVMWKAYLTQQAIERRKSKSHGPAAAQGEAQQFTQATRENAAKYTKPFCDFLTENPTVFHAISAVKTQLKDAGWTELSERDQWDIKPSGKYFVERNGSSMIAFSVGAGYKPGNGAAILAGHVDALTAKLKPISQVPNRAGYVQLGIAPYAGAPNTTWWDRDLGIAGRVLVREGDKIVTKLVKLDWPIARIPTLAPHFGAPAYGPFNPETQMVPIIGLEGTSAQDTAEQTAEPFSQPSLLGGGHGSVGSFVSTQPPKLVKAIAKELGLGVSMEGAIVNWELELYDVQGANVGGLDKEFIYAGRIDDKLCSWAAIQALIESQDTESPHSSIIKAVGLFDDEEIGSYLRQGARGNLLQQTIERAVGSMVDHRPTSDLIGRTYANSFLVSADVTHAVNPNFLGSYLENHSPHLNVGLVVSADSNGHMTTDSVSTALLKRCADKVGANLQVFQIRNDSRSGGTVGPMLSAATGMRAIDAGIPQLSMHSIRATTGALDPGLGVLAFVGFLNGFEEVDGEFR